MATPKAVPGVTRSQVLAALGAFIDRHGFSPTVRELAAACGISTSGCYHHLDELIKAGKVTEQPGRSRTLRVVEPKKVAG